MILNSVCIRFRGVRNLAHIHGPTSGHATITGTSGNDIIVAYADYNTITGGGGNDTIEDASGDYNLVSIGSIGDTLTSYRDIILLNGLFETVSGGDENLIVRGAMSDSSVSSGNGHNTIVVKGTSNSVTLGTGNSKVDLLGGSNHLTFTSKDMDFDQYADTVTLTGQHNVVVNSLGNYTGDDPGTLSLVGGSGFGSFQLGEVSGNVITNGLDNYIEVAADPFGPLESVTAGSGADTVTLDCGNRGQAGAFAVKFAGTNNLLTAYVDAMTVTGGTGYSRFDVEAFPTSSSCTIETSGLSNSFSLTFYNGLVDAGTGSDIVDFDLQ